MIAHATYTETARWLHWLVVAAIILQYVLAELAEQAAVSGSVIQQLALLAHHKSVGMTILVLALARLLWRWRHQPPPLPTQTPAWQRLVANLTHWGLYGLLLALPITGWLMSSASAYTVSWFNVLQLPDLIGPNETNKALLQEVHEWLAGGMFVLALLHLGAAVKHALVDRDQILQQMSSTWALAAAVVVLGAGGLFLLPSSTRTPTAVVTQDAGPARPAASASPSAPIDPRVPKWQLDLATSHIEFTAEQAGAPFSGRWQDWRAEVRFDPEQLDASSARVIIRTAAVSTDDDDRDNNLREREFFDTSNFPEAIFSASDFAQTEQGFVARGHLEIKGLRLPLDFHFNISQTDERITLEGNAQIDRLMFNVGTGDWQDTTWVGQYVEVMVLVSATVE